MSVQYYDDSSFHAIHKLSYDGNWYHLVDRPIRTIRDDFIGRHEPDYFETEYKVTLLKSIGSEL